MTAIALRLLFWLGVVVVAVGPVLAKILLNDLQLSWITFLVGLCLVFISIIDRLTEFSLGPIKARMILKIEEAEVILKKIQNTALASAEVTLTDLMAGSFMGSMSLKQRITMHDKVVRSLRGIGVDEGRIILAESNWRKGIAIVYCRAIQWRVGLRKEPHQINPDAPKCNQDAVNELRVLSDFSNWTEPSPEKIREVLRKYSISLKPVEKWIDDYAHFIASNEIRNLDAFVQE